jgi:hypothetical protein
MPAITRTANAFDLPRSREQWFNQAKELATSIVNRRTPLTNLCLNPAPGLKKLQIESDRSMTPQRPAVAVYSTILFVDRERLQSISRQFVRCSTHLVGYWRGIRQPFTMVQEEGPPEL